ncbi:MAG: rhamnogalacturonan acetylesterase [Hyphomonadaceae bacterium]|nr:rhamnogalacturonan acetylesterase [Hyphomonadaceae bacterium]
MLALATLAGACSHQAPQPPRVIIVGDSTASAYGPERYPRMGWGMVLACGLSAGVTVDNRAVSGRSTKSFIDEGHWSRAIAQARPGDVVLIQFGHNDEKVEDPTRFTQPAGAFTDNLQRFIEEVRASGASPVLVTPVARRRFVDGRAADSHGAYDDAVRALAAATRTPMVDLASDSLAFLQSEGEEGSRRFYLHLEPADGVAAYPQGVRDDTHFSEHGARAIARLVAKRLATLATPLRPFVRARARALQPGFITRAPSCDPVQKVPG